MEKLHLPLWYTLPSHLTIIARIGCGLRKKSWKLGPTLPGKGVSLGNKQKDPPCKISWGLNKTRSYEIVAWYIVMTLNNLTLSTAIDTKYIK